MVAVRLWLKSMELRLANLKLKIKRLSPKFMIFAKSKKQASGANSNSSLIYRFES